MYRSEPNPAPQYYQNQQVNYGRPPPDTNNMNMNYRQDPYESNYDRNRPPSPRYDNTQYDNSSYNNVDSRQGGRDVYPERIPEQNRNNRSWNENITQQSQQVPENRDMYMNRNNQFDQPPLRRDYPVPNTNQRYDNNVYNNSRTSDQYRNPNNNYNENYRTDNVDRSYPVDGYRQQDTDGPSSSNPPVSREVVSRPMNSGAAVFGVVVKQPNLPPPPPVQETPQRGHDQNMDRNSNYQYPLNNQREPGPNFQGNYKDRRNENFDDRRNENYERPQPPMQNIRENNGPTYNHNQYDGRNNNYQDQNVPQNNENINYYRNSTNDQQQRSLGFGRSRIPDDKSNINDVNHIERDDYRKNITAEHRQGVSNNPLSPRFDSRGYQSDNSNYVPNNIINNPDYSQNNPQYNQNPNNDRNIPRSRSPPRSYNQPNNNYNNNGTVEVPKPQNVQAVKNLFEKKSTKPLFPKTNIRPVPPRPTQNQPYQNKPFDNSQRGYQNQPRNNNYNNQYSENPGPDRLGQSFLPNQPPSPTRPNYSGSRSPERGGFNNPPRQIRNDPPNSVPPPPPMPQQSNANYDQYSDRYQPGSQQQQNNTRGDRFSNSNFDNQRSPGFDRKPEQNFNNYPPRDNRPGYSNEPNRPNQAFDNRLPPQSYGNEALRYDQSQQNPRQMQNPQQRTQNMQNQNSSYQRQNQQPFNERGFVSERQYDQTQYPQNDLNYQEPARQPINSNQGFRDNVQQQQSYDTRPDYSKNTVQSYNTRGSRLSFNEEQYQYDGRNRLSTGSFNSDNNRSGTQPQKAQFYSKSMNNLDQVSSSHLEIESYEESTIDNENKFSSSPNLKPMVVAVAFHDDRQPRHIGQNVQGQNINQGQLVQDPQRNQFETERQPHTRPIIKSQAVKSPTRVGFTEPVTQTQPNQLNVSANKFNQDPYDNSSEVSNYVPSLVSRSYDAYNGDGSGNVRHSDNRHRSNDILPNKPKSPLEQQHPQSITRNTDPGIQNDSRQNIQAQKYGKIQYTVAGPKYREGIPTPPRTDKQLDNNTDISVDRNQMPPEDVRQQRKPVSYANDGNWRVASPAPQTVQLSQNNLQQHDKNNPPNIIMYNNADSDGDSSEGIDVDAPTPPLTDNQRPTFRQTKPAYQGKEIYQQNRPKQSVKLADENVSKPRTTITGYHLSEQQMFSHVKPPLIHKSKEESNYPVKPQRNSQHKPMSPTIMNQRDIISEEDSGIFEDKNGSTLSNASSRDRARLGKSGAMGKRKPPTRMSSSMNIAEAEENENDFQIEVTNVDLQNKPRQIEVHREQSMKEIRRKQAARKSLLERERTDKPTHDDKHIDEAIQTDFYKSEAVVPPPFKHTTKFVFKVPQKSVPQKDISDIPLATDVSKDGKKQPKYGDLLDQFKSARESAVKSAHAKQDRALKTVNAIVRMSKKKEPDHSPPKGKIIRSEKNLNVVKRVQEEYLNDVKRKEEEVARETKPSLEKSRQNEFKDQRNQDIRKSGRDDKYKNDRDKNAHDKTDRDRDDRGQRRNDSDRRKDDLDRDRDHIDRHRENNHRSRDYDRNIDRRKDDYERRDPYDKRDPIDRRDHDRREPYDHRDPYDRRDPNDRRGRDPYDRNDNLRRSPPKHHAERREPSRNRRPTYDDDEDYRRDEDRFSPRRPPPGYGGSRDREPDWVQQFRKNRGPESKSGSENSKVVRRAWVNDPRRRDRSRRELDMDEFEREVRAATSYNSDFEQPEPPRRQMMPTKLMAKKPPPTKPSDDWMKALKQKNKSAERHRYRR